MPTFYHILENRIPFTYFQNRLIIFSHRFLKNKYKGITGTLELDYTGISLMTKGQDVP